MTALALVPGLGDRRGATTVPGPHRWAAPPGAGAGAVAPCRPRHLPEAHLPEAQTRCHPARPTRAGCAAGVGATRPSVTVRRRRVVLGAVVVGFLAALALPWGGAGGHSPVTPGAASAAGLARHTGYVVEPGDTLWSIARRLDPSGDPRPVVAQLAAEVGSDTVFPGEHVVLP